MRCFLIIVLGMFLDSDPGLLEIRDPSDQWQADLSLNVSVELLRIGTEN
jgi:hypothetical protein